MNLSLFSYFRYSKCGAAALRLHSLVPVVLSQGLSRPALRLLFPSAREKLMRAIAAPLEQVDPRAWQFYRHALETLDRAGVPYLIGGAYALEFYTGIVRHTKDLDVFVRPADVTQTLAALERAGQRTELTFPHWLGKAFAGGDFVDVIFCSGNGLCAVDDAWFAHAPLGQVLGRDVRLIPAEEMIWQKAFIMERERFDGADVAHLLRARGSDLDWPRLLARFGPSWRVLLAQLVLFGFVYPGEQDKVPAAIFNELLDRLNRDRAADGVEGLCRGPLLSRKQYLIDTEIWGYGDARLPPLGLMTPEQITRWTAGIEHH
jgi:hypothetical protein